MPPVPEPESPDEYRYSGWLSFYPYRTDIKGSFKNSSWKDDAQETLRNKLPEYEQGDPSAPGDGFRIANTPNLLQESGLFSEYPHLDNLIHLKYIQEEYQNTLAYDEEEDDFVEANTVEINASDIFWTYPNYIFIRSSRQVADSVQSRLRSILVNSLRTEKTDFARDFLIWLIYKNYAEEGVNSGINLEKIQSMELSDESERVENQTEFSDFTSSSKLSLLPIIEGNIPESIEAVFTYQDFRVVASIRSDRIQILTSKGSLSELFDLEKMALAISFVSEFTTLYDEWTYLPSEERYPPTEFLKDVFKQAIEEGYETKGISQELIEKYKKYNQDG